MKDSDTDRRQDEPNSFRRFEDLTKRLLSVSKRETYGKTAQQKRRNNPKPR